MEIEFQTLFIAVITCFIGASVRIAYEGEKQKVLRKRVLFVYLCSIVVSFLLHEAVIIYSKQNWTGIAGIVGGIVSVDIVKFFIEDLRGLVNQYLKKKINQGTKTQDYDID